MNINQPISQWFARKGIAGPRVSKFINDILPLVRTSPLPGPGRINARLEKAGWTGLDLDDAALTLILDGLEQAGIIGSPAPEPVEDPKGLARLLEKIYQDRGVDFRGYARTSIARRISRRMAEQGADAYPAYAALLDSDPGEYELLFDEISVTVTRFFRNQAAFDALEGAVKTILTASDRPVSIWSAGCATGQEPYSIAMRLDRLLKDFPGREFIVRATDIDTRALDIARTGRFEPEAIKEVPPDWLADYFIDQGDFLEIRENLRKRVVFEPHNIVSDPLFGPQDIIVCRNVLIYFNLSLQMRVARLFYNALRPGGFLLLGRYEMLLKEARRQFSCVDFDTRLYRRKR